MKQGKKMGYRAIKEEIISRINNRIWAPGFLIPREIELADEFGCARATINRAMRELANEGLIERKRKSGSKVKDTRIRMASFEIPLLRTEIESTGSTYLYSLVHRNIEPMPAWLYARLGLSPGINALHLQCMHYSNSAPFMFEDRWINLDAVPKAVEIDFSKINPNEWLVTEIPFTDVEISFFASPCTQDIAEFLSAIKGEPIFTGERTTWALKNPVTYVKMSYAQGYRMTTRY